MAEETQFTANTGMATINTANPNLDGTTGVYTLVLTAAAQGTKIKSIRIKAVGSTTAEGMVRFFIFDGTNKRLFAEIEVPIITQSAKNVCFESYMELDLDLKSGDALYASTEIADTFNIIAEGLNWTYYSTSVRTDTTLYTANTGFGTVTVANSNLDGTGTTVPILTAATAASGFNGCRINSITIKSTGNNTDGVVRLFIKDTISTIKLLTEVETRVNTHSAKAESFSSIITFYDYFCIAPGYSIVASTQNGDDFAIVIDAEDWKYLP